MALFFREWLSSKKLLYEGLLETSLLRKERFYLCLSSNDPFPSRGTWPPETVFCHFLRKYSIFFILFFFEKLFLSNKVRGATMTHFCTFGTVTPVLIIGFGWFFLKIDRSRSQAALMQVSSTLLISDSRMKVKCETIFCVSGWQITSHDDTYLKSIENSKGHHDTTGKKFSYKKILYFWQKCDFSRFISISIHYDRL